MSAEPLPPRLAPVPPDGFGPDSLGHRIPAIRTPARLAALVASLTMARTDGGPLVPEGRLEALLRRLYDRLAAARVDRDSGEGEIVFRWHAGALKEFRFDMDERG